jgi:high-affinity K+ transport system ATPase subunit B
MSILKKIYFWIAFSFFGDSLTEEEIKAHLERLRAKRKGANKAKLDMLANEISHFNAELLKKKSVVFK